MSDQSKNTVATPAAAPAVMPMPTQALDIGAILMALNAKIDALAVETVHAAANAASTAPAAPAAPVDADSVLAPAVKMAMDTFLANLAKAPSGYVVHRDGSDTRGGKDTIAYVHYVDIKTGTSMNVTVQSPAARRTAVRRSK